MTPSKAAVVLVVAVIAIGAIGYFVLNAVAVVHTSTRNSCDSPATPQCSGQTHSSTPDTAVAIAAGAPSRG